MSHTWSKLGKLQHYSNCSARDSHFTSGCPPWASHWNGSHVISRNDLVEHIVVERSNLWCRTWSHCLLGALQSLRRLRCYEFQTCKKLSPSTAQPLAKWKAMGAKCVRLVSTWKCTLINIDHFTVHASWSMPSRWQGEHWSSWSKALKLDLRRAVAGL